MIKRIENIINNKIDTYCKNYLTEKLTEKIIGDKVTEITRNIILGSKIENNILKETQDFVDRRFTNKDIETILYKSIGYRLKNNMSNMKTFKELGEMNEKTLQELLGITKKKKIRKV